MRTVRAALLRLAEVFRRQRGEQEFAAEIECHLRIHIGARFATARLCLIECRG